MRKLTKISCLLLIIIIVTTLTGCVGSLFTENPVMYDTTKEQQDVISVDDVPAKDEVVAPENEQGSKSPTKDTAKIYFINVGQADSILIVSPNGKSILVDAGEKRDGAVVINALKEAGVKEIDLMVATHPHADHIGGMESVIKEFDTKEIMMSSFASTTQTFEKLLDEIDRQYKGLTQAEVGLTREIDGLQVEVLGVDTNPKDANNSSVVMKVTFGETSIVLTGDVEAKSELQIVTEVGNKLNADILKVAHHGSDTSTSDEFLKAVNPKIAVISVGVGNKYKHPSDSTLTKLLKREIKVFRTDESGTIILELDGTSVTTSKGTESSKGQSIVVADITTKEVPEQATKVADDTGTTEEIVYITNTGTKYHRSGCSSLSKSKIEATLAIAQSKGLSACSKCY